jgi:DNA helicase-2/ATP-dependent DNA helicase PcrA
MMTPADARNTIQQNDYQSEFRQAVAKLYPLYEEKLRAANALDFDDLLLYPLRLFKKHPDVLEQYQRRFRHLLIDEYQDTNRAQYELTVQMGDKADSVCVVGDDDQSIYRWRGAHPENLDRFRKDFAPVEVIRLEENYRSTRAILAGATAVVNRNVRRDPKRLIARRGSGELIRILELMDEEAEAETVAGFIEKWTAPDEEFDAGDCAVFFRTAAQSRPVEESLIRRGIPYTLVGGVKFYERKEVKDILCYARLALNPRDPLALQRIAGLGHWGVGARTVEQVVALSERLNKTPLDLSGDELKEALRSNSAKAFMRLQGRLKKWHLELRDPEISLMPWLAALIRESNYMAILEEKISDRESKRQVQNIRENLDQLLGAVADFCEKVETIVEAGPEQLKPADQLELFLAQSSLMSDVDYWSDSTATPEEEKDKKNRVTLMTLHSAKGLEFPIVFIVGCEEELFPHSRSLEDQSGVEEERRLCYVGMTRAEQRLVLTYAQSRRVYGQVKMRAPSRFLKEIPEDCVQKVSMTKPAAPGKPQKEFTPGDRVRHSVFGTGRVVHVSGRGVGLKVQVDFPRHGRKTLMQSYAKLRKV